MQLRTEALRIKQMMSGLTINWPIFLMDFTTLDLIESGATNGDEVLAQAKNDLFSSLRSITTPENYNAISQAYEFYEEANIYLLLRSRGFPLIRTPGTGGHGQKRPDFQCNHPQGTFYIEIKTLDFQDGWVRHKAIANDALEAKAELDARARKPGVHVGNPTEISSHRPGSSAADRIETAIKKIKSNIKRDQLRYGPTILVIDLSRLSLDAHDPSSLVPIYFDDQTQSCASGELWHVSFGEMGDRIFVRPEFEGKSNLDRKLQETGVYVECPELMALTFIIRPLSGPAKVYSFQKFTPDFSGLTNQTALKEHQIEEILDQISDASNDSRNEGAFGKQIRK